MQKERLKCLVDEYKLAEARLNEIRQDHIKAETALEISEEMKKDLRDELDKAKNSDNPLLLEQWQNIEQILNEDQDFPNQEAQKAAVEKISGQQKKLIIYYEKKLKSIRKLLGDRITEILEGYAEKNILMGGGTSSESSVRRLIEKEEEAKEIRERREKKRNVNFDKM